METDPLVYSNSFLNTTFHFPVLTLTAVQCTGRQAISRAIASNIMVTFHHMMDLYHKVDLHHMVDIHHMVTFHHFENKMVWYHHMMDPTILNTYKLHYCFLENYAATNNFTEFMFAINITSAQHENMIKSIS